MIFLSVEFDLSSPVPRPAFHRLQYDKAGLQATKSRAASGEKLAGRGTGNEANCLGGQLMCTALLL